MADDDDDDDNDDGGGGGGGGGGRCGIMRLGCGLGGGGVATIGEEEAAVVIVVVVVVAVEPPPGAPAVPSLARRSLCPRCRFSTGFCIIIEINGGNKGRPGSRHHHHL